MKRIVLFLVLLLEAVQAQYIFYYKGFKVAEIETLDTIHQTYIRAKITNPLYRIVTGEPYVVYYHDYKPDYKDTKYRRDWQMYFTVLRYIVEQRPAYMELVINEENHAYIVCDGDVCLYKYLEGEDKVISKGKVEFDENGDVLSIFDEENNAQLIKI